MGIYVKDNNTLKPLAGVDITKQELEAELKGYIRDQNKLSDIENYSVPATNITVEYDGFIYGFSNTYGYQGNVNLFVNDVNVTNGLTFELASATFAYPLNKGDIVRCSTGAVVICHARWYKLRDYSDR